MTNTNNLTLLYKITTLLTINNIHTWIFGGWAEEIQEIIPPRIHKDIDLLYPASDFNTLDIFLKKVGFEEIKGKHFFHKRAFLYQGIMVEIFLIQNENSQYFTNFFNKKKLFWPANCLQQIDTPKGKLNIASIDSLNYFRHNYIDFSFNALNTQRPQRSTSLLVQSESLILNLS